LAADFEGDSLSYLLDALENSSSVRRHPTAAGVEARSSLIAELEARLLVPPGPSAEAAFDALPRVVLHERDAGTGAQCSICLVEYFEGQSVVQVVQLPCRHCFCEGCARAWLAKSETCPLCRKCVAAADGTAPSVADEAEQAWWRLQQGVGGGGAGGAAASSERLGTTAGSGPRRSEMEQLLFSEAVASARQRRTPAPASGTTRGAVRGRVGSGAGLHLHL
jgi:hypothetical protein